MLPSSFTVTINLRFVATILLAGTIALLSTSWSEFAHRPSEDIAAGPAAFSTAVTSHTIALNGKKLAYRAKAGYLGIGHSKGRAAANVFYVAYSLDNNVNVAKRPVTFVFNGGPGSSALWLHMGSFGPVRVGGNGRVEGNNNTWLGFTDLVFIDPVGTGYSRAANGTEARKFYGYKEDIGSIAEFIRAYLADNGRENDAVFLAGESYGGLRAVGLAENLQANGGVKLAGITLISPALNYQLISFKEGNETPYAYYLPTYAVTARYHHKLDARLDSLTDEQLMSRATAFGQGTYTRFLHLGDAAPQALINKVIDSLHYFTGLSRDYLTEANGRVTDGQFTAELLGSDSQTLGTFDGRVKDTLQHGDPSIAAILTPFTRGFQQYAHQVLKYDNQLPYLATTATSGWNYGQGANNCYINASATLKTIMTQNPGLKVQVVGGYYDLATPVAATHYVLNHLGLKKQIRKNLIVKYYKAGHMLYTSDTANAAFKDDSRAFYASATVSVR